VSVIRHFTVWPPSVIDLEKGGSLAHSTLTLTPKNQPCQEDHHHLEDSIRELSSSDRDKDSRLFPVEELPDSRNKVSRVTTYTVRRNNNTASTAARTHNRATVATQVSSNTHMVVHNNNTTPNSLPHQLNNPLNALLSPDRNRPLSPVSDQYKVSNRPR
jgi:hypothetical protein